MNCITSYTIKYVNDLGNFSYEKVYSLRDLIYMVSYYNRHDYKIIYVLVTYKHGYEIICDFAYRT